MQLHGPDDDNGCESSGQATHVLAAVAAIAKEYLPVSHSVQFLLPVLLYFPASQATHGPPSGPRKPDLQMQLVNAGDPLGDSLFAGQGEHMLLILALTDVEYVFALQSMHILDAVAFSEYLPATQPMHAS